VTRLGFGFATMLFVMTEMRKQAEVIALAAEDELMAKQ
jgi:hypothetical protein